MTRPLIGLTGRRKKGHQLADNLASLADADFDMYYTDYARAVLHAGGLPVHLPLDIDPAEVIDRLDGVLLSGGADIGPARYGAVAESETQPTEFERDDFELALLDQVADRRLPALGICRGIQMINVHAGGTLHQHVPTHAGFDGPVHAELHEVRLEADSVLAGLYGERRSVNSLHHQSIDRVGDGFRVTASADDDGVEGIEHRDLPWVAVQWHPEMMLSAASDPIFGWLVDQASG